MEIRRSLALVTLLAAMVTVQTAAAQEHPTSAEHPAKAEQPIVADSIVGVAAATDGLGTFLAAVKAAGLTERLQGEGPFTVFAPTDEAFAKLPAGALDDLLRPANRAKLAGLLACHVVPGKLLAADVKTMKAANVSGQDLAIEVRDGAVTVDGARVVKTDLVCANGVIHAIDTVIMPRAAAEPTSDKPKDHPGH